MPAWAWTPIRRKSGRADPCAHRLENGLRSGRHLTHSGNQVIGTGLINNIL